MTHVTVFIVTLLLGGVCAAEPLDRITLSSDRATLIHAGTKTPFHPWGLNYDRDHRMRLIEDYWETEWSTVAADFAEMKRLGANVVRIHLQIGRFMEAADRPDERALAQLSKLLRLAEETGIYLDLTGLACYRRTDVPAWYDELDEVARWQAQASFWGAVAKTCAKHGNVFCYDLVNEPSVPAKPRKPGDWLAGDLAGFTYCQVITLDPKGRDRAKLAIEWTRQMSAAIRKHDSETLITVGLLPFPTGAGFDAAELAPHLDFVSVHYYPRKGKLDEQAAFLKKFSTGKPLVVEEVFPLECGTSDLADFIRKTPFVCGWVGFYWGPPLAEVRKSKLPKDAMIAGWLTFFEQGNPNK